MSATPVWVSQHDQRSPLWRIDNFHENLQIRRRVHGILRNFSHAGKEAWFGYLMGCLMSGHRQEIEGWACPVDNGGDHTLYTVLSDVPYRVCC